MDYEKLGLFYLGTRVDPQTGASTGVPLLYDAADLVTHAVIVGMTGSGKTGLGIGLMEEAALDRIPVIAIDPKGDLANLLLTFPDLSAGEFAPWVNPDEARQYGRSVDEQAEVEAARWRDGLTQSGQSAERIKALRAAADFVLYTPGSRAGRPLSILKTFQAPAGAAADPELLTDRASAAATSLLTLAGIDAEPVRSREHILLATLLAHAWREQRSTDLATLIAQVQTPPMARIGVLELDSFFPPGDRFTLASDLNRLLAAPDFAVWLEGDALDIGAMLYAPAAAGSHALRPRVTVLSIAHLDDRERMFFVSMLLNEIVAWMRAQRGTSTLRALLYFDEVMGFLPPVANPPSKAPLLTLLKQARAAGLGLTLATQNPVDLDYKALSNAGTWFLGRLQTERDKARVLDGLESAIASAGHSIDRATMDRLLSGLQKRTFVMHNVHESGPVLFTTRWTMSYLRGPLGRDELARLRGPEGGAEGRTEGGAERRTEGGTLVPPGAASFAPAHPAPAHPRHPAPEALEALEAPEAPEAPALPAPATAAPPLLPPTVPQYYAPGRPGVWRPALAGAARIHYSDGKLRIDETRDIVMVTPFVDGPMPVDWDHAEPAPFAVRELQSATPVQAPHAPVPKAATDPRRYAAWSKDFARWAAQTQSVELLRSSATKAVSHPDESERDFRIRVETSLREQRDAAISKVRDKYAARLGTLEDRLRRAAAAVQREQQQASESKMQAGVSIAATVFGALLGRKPVSASTLGRATTAARGVSRAGRAAEDVTRAQAEVKAVRAKRDELAAMLDQELQRVAADWDAREQEFERVLVKPKRGGVAVQLVALVWLPE